MTFPKTIIAACVGAALVADAPGRAQDNAEASVDCAAFRRNSDGTWTAPQGATVAIGKAKVTIGVNAFGRKAVSVNGTDLAEFLDKSCAVAVPERKN